MTMPSSFSSRLAVLMGVSMVAGPVLAFEPTGNDAADAFLELLQVEDGTVDSYGSVNENGDKVTISEIRLSNESDDDSAVYIATVTLDNGVVLDSGRLALDSLAMGGIEVDSDEVTMELSSFNATALTLPAPGEVKGNGTTPGVGPNYATLEINGISLVSEDGNAFDIARLTSTIDAMSGDLPTAGSFSIEELTVEAENLDEDGKKALTDLGYETMTISVSGTGAWDPEAATLKVSDLNIEGEDAGALTVSLALGGVTREVMEQLNTTQDDPGKALGIVQGVLVENITITLDNESLVERVLDAQAKEAGTDRAAFVTQLNAGLPMMLTMLQNQAFQDKVSTAVATFLENPVNLTVTAAPANPVPVPQIMGAAMMAPQSLPQVLGVDIQANK